VGNSTILVGFGKKGVKNQLINHYSTFLSALMSKSRVRILLGRSQNGEEP